MFRPLLLSAATALALSFSSAQAVLLDYWSFNGDSLNPNLGVATLQASHSGAGFMAAVYGAGTTVNSQLGYPAGKSAEFLDTVAAFANHKLTLSALDFTGQSNVSLSFAYKSSAVFGVGESASISYRIGAGSWNSLPLSLPGTNWTTQTISFNSLLDNVTDVSIRIEHDALFEVGEVLAFDNLAVAAVPEPGTIALLGGAAIVLVGLRRFARRA